MTKRSDNNIKKVNKISVQGNVSKLDLSLVVITLNEESSIERCISSVPFASEVIVVDSGSIDNTKEIAEKLGAKVYHQDWLGYGAQKKFATQKAGQKWILSLDADEWLSDELRDEIQEVLSRDGLGYFVYSMRRLSQYMGKWIYYGGWFPDWQVRLFKNGIAQWDDAEEVHETIKTSEDTARLAGVIYHKPFESIKEQVDVNFKYARLIAEKKYRIGRRLYSPYLIPLKTISRFLENLVWKKGFLDGVRGFIIAVNSAQSYMMQLYHLYRKSLRDKVRK
jgi:glycosyltransferase involved in cell wall biosynthesis